MFPPVLAGAAAAVGRDYALEYGESVDAPPLCELDWRPLVRAVARDVERGLPAAAIAAGFHAALADAIERVAERHANLPVVLGGGFVNTELRELTETRLFDYVDYVTLDAGERPLLALPKTYRSAAQP